MKYQQYLLISASALGFVFTVIMLVLIIVWGCVPWMRKQKSLKYEVTLIQNDRAQQLYEEVRGHGNLDHHYEEVRGHDNLDHHYEEVRGYDNLDHYYEEVHGHDNLDHHYEVVGNPHYDRVEHYEEVTALMTKAEIMPQSMQARSWSARAPSRHLVSIMEMVDSEGYQAPQDLCIPGLAEMSGIL